MTTTPTVSSDHLPPMNLEVGDIIEGEVVSKTDQMTSVAIEQRIVKLSNDVEVVSEVGGEKILLEVKKVTEDSVELKIVADQKLGEEARSIDGAINKPLEITKEFDASLIKIMNQMDIEQAKAIEMIVKKC